MAVHDVGKDARDTKKQVGQGGLENEVEVVGVDNLNVKSIGAEVCASGPVGTFSETWYQIPDPAEEELRMGASVNDREAQMALVSVYQRRGERPLKDSVSYSEKQAPAEAFEEPEGLELRRMRLKH